MPDADVAIVGARVAGSVLAALLGEAGYRVIAVDAAAFPSDTISTHFFRGAGLGSVLERLGLVERVRGLGSPELRNEYTYPGENGRPRVGPPQDPGSLGYCLSVRRQPLDAILVERARAIPGVEIWESTPARGLLVEDGRVVGIEVDRAGSLVPIRARLVVGADGRASSVARWLDAPIERREPAARAMYYRYLRDFPGPDGSWDGPEFSFVGDEIAYAFPSDDGVMCLAVSVNLEAFGAFRTRSEAAFDERIARHSAFAARFEAASRDGRLLASGPKDALIRTPTGPGWALVGDASLSQDPWTGLGMDNAGVHATFLAEAVDDWLSGRVPESTSFARYGLRLNEHAMAGFDFTAELGRDLSRMSEA